MVVIGHLHARGSAINYTAYRADLDKGMVAPTQHRLMLVEDDPCIASAIYEKLVDHFGPGSVEHYDTVVGALSCDVNRIDLVLTNMNLPDGSGLDLLSQLLERRPDLPVVLVTDEGILENALTAIRRGAYDYILKAGNYLFAIPVIVEKNLAIFKTKQENARLHNQLTQTVEEVRVKNRQLEQMISKLETMAATDPLTGLANRRAFGDAVQRCFAEANRYQHDLACIMIDLDGFKRLNDTLGHQVGDKLLMNTAQVLGANCRRSDVAGRFGGDEFVLLLPQTGLSTAERVAKRISKQFEISAKAMLKDMDLFERVTMSIGLSTLCHSQPNNPEQLVAHADHALYRAKLNRDVRVMPYHDPATDSDAIAPIS